jgi:hypothetical protein
MRPYKLTFNNVLILVEELRLDRMVNTAIGRRTINRRLVVFISSIILVVILLFSFSRLLGKEDNFGLYLDKDVYVVGERAILKVWNDSPYTITYGYNYRFQVEIDGEWINITNIGNYVINSTGVGDEAKSTGHGVEAVILSGEERTEVIDISKLDVGHYVFIQEVKQHKPKIPFLVDDVSIIVHTFIKEFEIKQN